MDDEQGFWKDGECWEYSPAEAEDRFYLCDMLECLESPAWHTRCCDDGGYAHRWLCHGHFVEWSGLTDLIEPRKL